MEENNSNSNMEQNVNIETNAPENLTQEDRVNTETTSVNGTQNTTQIENKKLNVCCLLSFIFSMIGILMFGLPCGIASTILGIIGLATFNPKHQYAKWLGITGLCVGAVEVVLMGMYVFIS